MAGWVSWSESVDEGVVEGLLEILHLGLVGAEGQKGFGGGLFGE